MRHQQGRAENHKKKKRKKMTLLINPQTNRTNSAL
jgi:hypothetical protein